MPLPIGLGERRRFFGEPMSRARTEVPYTAPEIARIWRGVRFPDAYEPVTNTRNRVAVATLLLLGLRGKELRLARWADLRGGTWLVRKEVSKGGYGDRRLALSPLLRQLLTDWRGIQRAGPTGYVFGRSPAIPLKRGSLHKAVQRWCAGIGVSHASVSRFRPTFAGLYYLHAGERIVPVSAALGHASLDTTQGYIEAIQRQNAMLRSMEGLPALLEALTAAACESPRAQIAQLDPNIKGGPDVA